MAQTHPARIDPESGKPPDQNRLGAPAPVSRGGRDGSRPIRSPCVSPPSLPCRVQSHVPSRRACHVLAEDPDLAEAIAPAHQSGAIEHCIAPAVNLPRGRWKGQRKDMTPGGIGLLVLHGLLIRRVGVGGGFGAELLGQGDLSGRGKARAHNRPSRPSRAGTSSNQRVLRYSTNERPRASPGTRS